jgi:SAM-dependent methyltransferase
MSVVRPPLARMLWAPGIRRHVARLPVLRRIYDGWARRHPFDVLLDTDTSGSVPAEICAPGMGQQISPYGGSQPSIVRRALQALPEPARYAFIDIGCGKGRPLIVASELPFTRVTGVELSPELAAVARDNAAAVGRRHGRRVPIDIQVGDATIADAPADHVVYFLYHPFGGALVQAFVRNLERHLSLGVRHGFVVYYNPVHGEVMDESRKLARWSADVWPYAPEEIGFGPDLADTVVIWQTMPGRYAARPNASRRIVVTGNKADLRD